MSEYRTGQAAYEALVTVRGLSGTFLYFAELARSPEWRAHWLRRAAEVEEASRPLTEELFGSRPCADDPTS